MAAIGREERGGNRRARDRERERERHGEKDRQAGKKQESKIAGNQKSKRERQTIIWPRVATANPHLLGSDSAISGPKTVPTSASS